MWDGNALLIDEKPVNIHIPYKDKLVTLVENVKFPFFIISLLLTFIVLLWMKKKLRCPFISI